MSKVILCPKQIGTTRKLNIEWFQARGLMGPSDPGPVGQPTWSGHRGTHARIVYPILLGCKEWDLGYEVETKRQRSEKAVRHLVRRNLILIVVWHPKYAICSENSPSVIFSLTPGSDSPLPKVF